MRNLFLAVLGSLIVCPSSASASLIYTSIVTADSTVFQGAFVLDSDSAYIQLAGTDTLGPVEASASAAGNSGFSWASVTDGALHAFATSTDVSFDGTSTQTSANAYFLDTLLIQSSTLAFGTPVQLQFDQAFTSNVTACGSTDTLAYVLAQTSSGTQIQDHCDPANDFSNVILLVDTTIGAELQVWASMSLFAGAGFFGGTATADAAKTLQIFLTPLDAFTFTSASGNTYQRSTVAPEPASLLLVGTGLLGAGLRRWRHKRS